MMYVINENQKEPAYLQLYMKIREDIVKGIYPLGTKLPSKRTLAVNTGLSTITIEHAYSLLCDEGYIEARERSGYFVIFSTEDGFSGTYKINASENNILPNLDTRNTFPIASEFQHKASHQTTDAEFPFGILAKTMRQVISSLGESILDKSPNTGCFELRDANNFEEYQRRFPYLSKESVLVCSDAHRLWEIIEAEEI